MSTTYNIIDHATKHMSFVIYKNIPNAVVQCSIYETNHMQVIASTVAQWAQYISAPSRPLSGKNQSLKPMYHSHRELLYVMLCIDITGSK